ncbi:MAG: TonB-dependent receptor [Turneriella sp.]|nr:TonB-dependent receptor [Turneriella sp.]
MRKLSRYALCLTVKSLLAVDYNFDTGEETPVVSEPAKKAESRFSDKRKDTLTTADVFELFKGEQKVAIVSKKEERVQDAPATIYVVGEKEIKERGYLFLHDLLRDLPGIDFINDLGTYGMIAMQRGIDTPENNKTLIFIDGVLTNNPSQGVSYMSYQFALHNVKRVEVLWGPASALYGANAFSGIINIVTKTAADLEAEGKTGHASVGTIIPKMSVNAAPAGIYLDFFAGGKIWEDKDAARITVAGHYVRSDSGPDYARRHQVMPWASANTEYYIPDNAMPILGNYNAQVRIDYKDLTIGGRVWKIMSKQGGFATYNWSATDLAYWGFVGQEAYAKYTHKFNQIFSAFGHATFRASQLPEGEYGKRVVDADRSSGGDDKGGNLLRYRRDDYAYSLDLQGTADWSTHSSTSVGIFGEYAKVSNWNTNDTSLRKWDGNAFVQRYPEEVQGTFTGDERVVSEGIGPRDKDEVYYNQYNLAAYLQHSQTFLDQLKMTLGGRADYFILKGIEGPEPIGTATASTCPATQCDPVPIYATGADAAAAGAVLLRSNVYYRVLPADVNVFSFNPRIGLVWNPNPIHTVKLLHGWAFRNPTVRERFSLTGSRIPIGGALKPEQIKTTELGYAIKPLKFLLAEVDFFWSEVKDLIQLSASRFGRPGRPTPMAQFQNIGSARLLGFELKTDIALIQKQNLSVLLFANYSFQNNRYLEVVPGGGSSLSHENDRPGDTQNSHQMPRVSQHKANLGLTFYIEKYWSVSPIYHYVGPRPNVITSPINYVPEYHLMNLSLGYHNPQNNWEASVYIWNLLDAEINDPGTRDAAGTYFSPLRPEARLTIWMRLTYRL